MFGPVSNTIKNHGRASGLSLAVVTALVLAIFVARGGQETLEVPPAPETEQEAEPDVSPLFEPSNIQAETEVLGDVRQVIPGRAVHVPSAGEDVVRLPAPPVIAPPPRPVNLGIVVVEAANRLSTRRGMVTLQGTQGIEEDTICQLADGREPPCHVLARTAVRRFVGQRQVSCTLTLRQDAGEDHVAPCTLADTDLALWVVGQGWAFADGAADATMLAAQTLARQEQRGLWAVLGASASDQ